MWPLGAPLDVDLILLGSGDAQGEAGLVAGLAREFQGAAVERFFDPVSRTYIFEATVLSRKWIIAYVPWTDRAPAVFKTLAPRALWSIAMFAPRDTADLGHLQGFRALLTEAAAVGHRALLLCNPTAEASWFRPEWAKHEALQSGAACLVSATLAQALAEILTDVLRLVKPGTCGADPARKLLLERHALARLHATEGKCLPLPIQQLVTESLQQEPVWPSEVPVETVPTSVPAPICREPLKDVSNALISPAMPVVSPVM
mmetsp:Transcript_86448/g.197205  ORF Transcript_86448/g.197205 Transcript_86448/m.197205 type:complete len:259 (+) Transcript_86448:65-841(+)|eukprot:CAMPEP_0204360810 /NCGR_PEP_ID=MMETSP0469-20131031/38328_1 /ASSEMBLY_ACC=CAM_ASM_000384 /TAXON_ID=2969 /ORGANISM="Oxyrrhis marina" /LENGTH=258 /DNA_ID=CAMNT_0051349101 /DNA_START=16 /DNA_END=792 /DNA_ORIENTATION=-